VLRKRGRVMSLVRCYLLKIHVLFEAFEVVDVVCSLFRRSKDPVFAFRTQSNPEFIRRSKYFFPILKFKLAL